MRVKTPGLCYWIGKSLYVSLTNRGRGLSLVASRGPTFRMSVASEFDRLHSEPSVEDVVEAVLWTYANDDRKKNIKTKSLDGASTRTFLFFLFHSVDDNSHIFICPRN